MKRRLIKGILICLVLGAMTTFAVAWWIALRVPHANFRDGEHELLSSANDLPKRMRGDVPSGFTQPGRARELMMMMSLDTASAGDKRVSIFGVSGHVPGIRIAHPRRIVAWHQSGWPMLCLESVGTLVIRETSEIHGATPDQKNWPVGVLPPDWLPEFLEPKINQPYWPGFTYTAALPTRPLWPGFGINILLFASVWFVVLFSPKIARYQIRRARGRCTSCGYLLRGLKSDRCPECGHACRMGVARAGAL